MGTRGLTSVVLDGEKKISQYQQWDSYPDGQGLDALHFLQGEGNVARLRDRSADVRPATEEELVAADAEIYRLGRTVREVFPQFSRDTGAGILEMVASGEAKVLVLDLEFEKDTLFCEGVFEVDFDRGVFETRIPGYSRPSQTVTFPLDALPSDDEYLDAFAEEDDDL